MSTINKVFILGRLGNDPALNQTKGGTAVATLSIATNSYGKDAQGNKTETTEWHRVVCWDRTAEIARDYLGKGAQAHVEGRLQTRKWTDNSGIERYSTEVICEKLTLIGSKADGHRQNGPNPYQEAKGKSRQSGPTAQQSKASKEFQEPDFNDDIPF